MSDDIHLPCPAEGLIALMVGFLVDLSNERSSSGDGCH